MSETKTAALYCRYSTDLQTENSQVHALQEFCKMRGFAVHRTYIDRGISGTKDNRPELNQLMADAKQGSFTAVICFRFDRFARSTRHLLSALEEFRSLEIDFISVSEAIDTSTPLGEALFVIVAAISRLERDILCQRVRAGLANAKARGKTLGRKKLRDDVQILALRNEGHSVRGIAKILRMSAGSVQQALKSVSKSSVDGG